MIDQGVYVFEAVRRAKDNVDGDPVKNGYYREVCYDDDYTRTINKLKAVTSQKPGIWRIYRSVNRRDIAKAKIELAKSLIDQAAGINLTNKGIETQWKTILSQPRNKAGKVWLLDVDIDSLAPPRLNHPQIEVLSIHRTPNGWAILVKPFDFNHIPLAEGINGKKDDLLFIERYEVE